MVWRLKGSVVRSRMEAQASGNGAAESPDTHANKERIDSLLAARKFFQEEQKRLEAERLAAKERERQAKEAGDDGRSSCGSVTSSQYAVAKKEKKKDIYDMQMEIKKSKEKVEEVEQDPILPELGLEDVAAVQRLLQSAYNAQRAFILAAEAQQQGGEGSSGHQHSAASRGAPVEEMRPAPNGGPHV